MSNEQPIVQIENIWKTFTTGDIVLHALRGINLRVLHGELVAIMGASGSGKSTLMNIMGCLDKATKGKYYFKDTDTASKSNTELAKLRRENFGFVFQSYNLLPRTTAFENVELPLLYGSKYNSKQRKEIVLNALTRVGLQEKIYNKTNQLSGGQQQRVAIARAIVNNPAIIFADEPTGNLDTRTSYEIMSIFQELNKQGSTIILVTHETDIANFAKRKIVFRDGKIITDISNEQKNAVEELLKLPVEIESTIDESL
ncbi:MAG: ABC transporter ATP-binding protein [Bacteroidota bacterium]